MAETEVASRTLNARALAQRYCEAGYWRAEDLWTSIESIAARNPEAIAFVQGGRSIRFCEIVREGRRFGAAAVARGAAPGDVVVIHARNCIEAIVALVGCASADLVAALLPPMFSTGQILSVIESAAAPLIAGLGDAADIERTREAASAAGVGTLVLADAAANRVGELAWSRFMALGDGAPEKRAPTSADDLSLLIFSSGTTGAPKGVMHSDNTLRFAAETYAARHAVTSKDKYLIVLEFGFVASSILGVLVPLLTGCTSVILRHWNVEEALDLIAEHDISYVFLMPTHAIDTLRSAKLERSERAIVARGVLAGLTPPQREDARQRYCATPLPMYGMSECPALVTGAPGDAWEKLLSTEGTPLEGTEVFICDDSDQVLPAGAKGNVLVRGPNRFLGYFKREESTAASITADGCFRTGDIGALDADGYFTFHTRNKDIIRRGGVTIVPSEVEAALRPHPLLSDVAIVAAPDARLGEKACACVIAKGGADVRLEDLTGFLEQQAVPRYLWPEYVCVFESFPRTPSLKVKKPELRELALGRIQRDA